MKENQKNTSPTCKPVGFGNTWILTNYAQKSPHRTHATCQITHVDCWGGWDKTDMLGVQGHVGNWWGGAVWRVRCVEPLICQVGETGKAASIQGPLYGHLSGLNLAHGEGGAWPSPAQLAKRPVLREPGPLFPRQLALHSLAASPPLAS